MKTTLDYLPATKQQELRTIVESIRQYPDVEAIILFGSYARGNWVEEYEDDGVHVRYQSDYDLLVVVKTRGHHRQRDLEDDMMMDIEGLPGITTPVSIIAHDIGFVRRQLEKAQYFFSDIKKQGVLLYNAIKLDLPNPKELTNEERYRLAKEDFDHYFTKAKNFLTGFNFYFNEKNYNEAAFLLHQTTEHLYNTLLLVFTRYKPKLHDLFILRRVTNTLDPRLLKILPLVNSEERHHFRLLRNAYVDARYNKNYAITPAELTWLAERIKALQEITEVLCQEKMQSFLQETEQKEFGDAL